jgi:hypothetical protein
MGDLASKERPDRRIVVEAAEGGKGGMDGQMPGEITKTSE